MGITDIVLSNPNYPNMLIWDFFIRISVTHAI